MDSIQSGLMFNGVFYPCDSTTYYGYVVEGQFHDLNSFYDFSRLPQGATAYCWTQERGWVLIPEGGKLGFKVGSTLFRSRSEAEQSVVLSRSSPHPPLFPTKREVRPPRKCFLCPVSSEKYIHFLGKVFCFACLKSKLNSGDLYHEDRDGIIPWTAEIVYDIFTKLSAESPTDLPSSCPLPYQSVICHGESARVADDYPPSGHIVGTDGLCIEDSCPTHRLCKKCAVRLTACPVCQHPVPYEVPGICSCGERLCYDFNTPCNKCHKIPSRKKKLAA